MNNEYTEEKLAEIENNILSGLDKEQVFLQEIENIAAHIAHQFVSGKNHIRYTFQETEYIFSLDADKDLKIITLLRTDPIKMNLGNGHYVPAIFRLEWDTTYTYEENVYALVKTALCSAAGIINTDALTETNDDTI
jgi:hypothetical protein